MMRIPYLRSEHGVALLIALVLILMMSIIGIGLVKSTNDEVSIAGNEITETKTFYAAEAGLDRAAAEIQAAYRTTDLPPEDLPSGEMNINEATVDYITIVQDTVQKTLSKGSLAGLNALVTPYVLRSSAYDNTGRSSVNLEEVFEVALVPIFQFSVFYETDLEIAPGPTMTLYGRIHSNRDVYLESGNRINIDSYFTAYGDIHHGRKPGSGLTTENGEVDIMGIDGTYRSMRETSGWLDADDSYWFDSAACRWGGRVQDASFGQEKLNLPIDNPDDPHTIIDRASAGGGNDDSYENKADFKIMDGVAMYKNAGGSWVDVTSALTSDGSLKTTTFYDIRETKNVTVYDINMSVFKSSPYFPSNGIMYTADNRSGLRGTRIYNATDIGYPLTIATENPLYTKGSVNTTTKKPMAIITDALTILSGNWSDASSKTTSSDKTVRPATNTSVNFSYITGNSETGGGIYSGGLENLPHFLEDWSPSTGSKTLTFRGSIINLWLSEKVSGIWGSYYDPPTRNWAFDTDLSDPNKLPPGTPMVRTFIRMGWRQANVGYAATEL